MLIASPDVMFLTTRPLYEENNFVYMDCTYSWPESSTKMYQLCIVTLLFVGPFVLMSISYSHIVNVLWRNETVADSLHHTSLQLEEEQQFLKRKYESMSATHEDRDGACAINHNSVDNNKNKSKLAIVTATAVEVDYTEKESRVSNNIGEKSNDGNYNIKHEERALQSDDITTNVNLAGTSLKPPSEVANQCCKNILEMDVKVAHKTLYTHAIDQAFSKQQESNCYQTSVTKADAVSYNKPDWRSTQMQSLNCKRGIVQRKLSAQEADTRYPGELMPMATTNLNPSNKRRHTIESHNHKHYVCCCENNDTRRCGVEDHSSTFIECLVNSTFVPSNPNLSSNLDLNRVRASNSNPTHFKLTLNLCALNHEISNESKVDNLASGSVSEKATNFKFTTEQNVRVDAVANGEAIELGAEKLTCGRKSARTGLIDDDDGGNRHRPGLVVDDVGVRIEKRSLDKSGLGQLKDGAEFDAIKDVASPKLTVARQKTTACFQPTRFAKEICSAPKVRVADRHISKSLRHGISKLGGSGKNSDPEKLISAYIAEKKEHKNLATSPVADMSSEFTTSSGGEKPRLVNYKELGVNSSDRGSSCIENLADNKKHDDELRKPGEHAVSSTLMTIAATTTNESSTTINGKEVIEDSALKSNMTNSNPLSCCECFINSLRRKSDKLKADKTLKKYRKNLANYAANKERYRDTTNSSRITRQTMFTSSFLKTDQATTNKSSSRRKFDDSQEQGNRSSSSRCHLNVETSANISKGVSNRDHHNSSSHSSHLAITTNDHSPSLASNNFNHQQSHAPYNSRFYKLIESRKKAAKMLIVIVIMFGLCYLPIHFLNTLR